MADKPIYPSAATWRWVLAYVAVSLALFAGSDKSPWVFAASCIGAIPLGMLLAMKDIARARR